LTIDGRELSNLSYEGGNERNAPASADPLPVEKSTSSPSYGEYDTERRVSYQPPGKSDWLSWGATL